LSKGEGKAGSETDSQPCQLQTRSKTSCIRAGAHVVASMRPERTNEYRPEPRYSAKAPSAFSLRFFSNATVESCYAPYGLFLLRGRSGRLDAHAFSRSSSRGMYTHERRLLAKTGITPAFCRGPTFSVEVIGCVAILLGWLHLQGASVC